MSIRILSWNVHGLPFPVTRHRRERMRRIARRIEAERPDVALLQEAWAGAIGPLAGLRGYSLHRVRTSIGTAAGGLVLFVRDASEWSADPRSLEFRRFGAAGPRHRFWEGDGLAGKGAAFLRLAHRDATPLWLVNTHLQSRYRAHDYAEVRLAQLHELARWLEALGSDAPVVVAGDFNTPGGRDPLYGHLHAIGVDLTARERETSGAVTNYPLHASAGWIDYVLLRPALLSYGSTLRLIENERLDHPYSDHSALVADIELTT